MIISDLNHLEVVTEVSEVVGAGGAQVVGDISAYIKKQLSQVSKADSSIVTNNNSYSPSDAYSSNYLDDSTSLSLKF